MAASVTDFAAVASLYDLARRRLKLVDCIDRHGQRELDRAGLRSSIPESSTSWGRIREITVLYPAAQPGQQPTLHTTLPEMNERQRELFTALGLDRYRTPS